MVRISFGGHEVRGGVSMLLDVLTPEIEIWRKCSRRHRNVRTRINSIRSSSTLIMKFRDK